MDKKMNWKITLLNLDVVIASAAMVLLVGLTFSGVIARYLIGRPFGWIEEVQAALIIWVIFGAAGAAFRSANHAAIEIFYEMFPAVIRKILDVFILLVSTITLLYLAKNSMAYINVFASTGRTTAVLHLSYIMIYCVAPVSCIWQVFNYILVNFFHYSEKEVIEAISEEEFEEARERMNSMIIYAAIILLVLLFLKVPVFISVLSASAIYFLGNPTINATVFAQQTLAGAQGLSLLAIPFFVMAGVFMNYTGVTRRIMECCNVLTSRMPGGLAQVNILLSTLMGGLSGSSLADAAMECKMLVPSMEAEGYSKPFSTVITAASGMVVPLIPPGTGLIIYACITNISVGKLFVAGIGPGLVLSITLMIFTHFLSKKRGYLPHRTTKIPISEKWTAIKPAILPMLLPIIIIGGVRIGIFTATEAGTIAIVYSLLLGILYREMKLSDFFKGCKETVTTTASIMLIVAAASCFSWILTKEQIPQTLAAWMTSAISNKFIFLIICNIFLIIVGMFIEGNASMIVLAPLLHPVAVAFGIDPIHFAMVYIFNCTIGAFTPPMGTLMFVTCGVTGCRTKDFIREAIPFYILFTVDMLILTYFPPLTTFLVDLVY